MKHKIRRILPYLFVFAAFLIVSSYIQDRNDDLVFQESYAQAGSLIEWIRWFANNWGGRVIPQGLLAVLLQLPPIVFGLLNAAATTALAWLSRRIIDRDGMIPDGAYCFVFVLGLLFALPREILRGTVYWKCADVLYLWGFSTLFAALYPFVCLLRGKKPGIPAWIAAFFCAAYTASFEQLGICMTGMMVLLYAYHVFFRDGCESIGQNPAYRFGNVPTVVLLLAAAGLTVVFSLMPGNAVRLEEETVRWYPQFAMQSVPEKIIQGLAYTVNGLEQLIMPQDQTKRIRLRQDPFDGCICLFFHRRALCRFRDERQRRLDGRFLYGVKAGAGLFWDRELRRFPGSAPLCRLSGAGVSNCFRAGETDRPGCLCVLLWRTWFPGTDGLFADSPGQRSQTSVPRLPDDDHARFQGILRLE